MNSFDLIKTAAEMAEVAQAQGYPTPTSFSTGYFFENGTGHDGISVHVRPKPESFAAWAAFVEADSFDYPDDRPIEDPDGNTYAYGTFAGVRVQIFTGSLPKPAEPEFPVDSTSHTLPDGRTGIGKDVYEAEMVKAVFKS